MAKIGFSINVLINVYELTDANNTITNIYIGTGKVEGED
jgi:hypothetical protein